jgi:hypothetical protein
MNYGEGITWIIVFKCSIQFVEGVERKMEFPIYQQVEGIQNKLKQTWMASWSYSF